MIKQTLFFLTILLSFTGALASRAELFEQSNQQLYKRERMSIEKRSSAYNNCIKKYGRGKFKSPYDKCNTCICLATGILSCTKKSCQATNNNTQQYNNCIRKYGRGSFKSPFDTCNTCRCGPNGPNVCTRMSCPKPQPRPKPTPKPNPNMNYRDCVKAYGSRSFKSPFDKCNTCTCSNKGGFACTLMACL